MTNTGQCNTTIATDDCVSKGLRVATETKALVLGRGVLPQVAQLFKQQFPGRKASVAVADAVTYRLVGRLVEQYLQAEGVQLSPNYIFTQPGLFAEYGYVQELVEALRCHDAIPVAVGGGTINDITKLASHIAGRPYMTVCTAASMDGYTSFGASITRNGHKDTIPCSAPRAVLADIDVIAAAPPALNASGYADLNAKVTCGADWILAANMGIEPIDPVAWDVAHCGLDDALSHPRGIADGDPEAIGPMVKALLASGFAMQECRSSRPASGAEHIFSHYWHMRHLVGPNGRPASHGFQVAIGTLAVLALYHQAVNTDLSQLDVEACVEQWPSIEQMEHHAAEVFRGTPFVEKAVIETTAKYLDRPALRRQLTYLRQHWPEICAQLKTHLLPWQLVSDRLEAAGAPVRPSQIGLTYPDLRDTFLNALYIRRRYTILDMALRTGWLRRWTDDLFAPSGLLHHWCE